MYSVLYVDDDEILLGLNKILLEKTGEFSVDIVQSAREGLQKLSAKSYDAIISDYDMPDMDGIALLKEVRLHYSTLPFLLFTGKGREDVVIQAVESGADYYIQKGPDMHGMLAELRHKIKRAIERRRLADDLERSRQQMTDIINFLPDATFVRDIAGQVIAWNLAMEKMTGISRDAILGKGDFEYALPFYREKRPLLADLVIDQSPDMESQYRYCERTGDKISSEVFIPHFNNGAGANLWCTASPLYSAHGTVTGAIESFRDISDFNAIKRDLSVAQEMNQGFADMIPVGIYEMDLSHTLTFANKIIFAWFGLSPDDQKNTIDILDHIAPVDRERAANDIKDVLFDRAGTGGQEYLLVRKDGTTFPAVIYAGKILDPESHNPVGVRGIIIDVTERKRQAQELIESRARLDLALEAGDIGIWDVDMRTMVINDLHKWAHSSLGYQRENLPQITVNTAKSLVHPLDLPRILFTFFLHISGKEPLFESEFRLAGKDGDWKWVAVRGKIIEWNAEKAPVRITGVINVITRPKNR